MLIRPDACVAWAGEENTTGGLDGSAPSLVRADAG